MFRLSLLMAVCFAVPCHSAEGFLEKYFGVTGRIQSVTVADFDRDSRPDIAIRTHEALHVLRNAGGGNFSPSMKTLLPWGFLSAGVTDYGVARAEVAADFDSDGNPDLAIRDRNEILFGVGDGTFLPPQPIRGDFPSFYGLTATGDFNADKKPDLLFFVRGSVALLYGNGDGTFRLGGATELGGDGQLLVGDLDGDGASDLMYLQYPAVPPMVEPRAWYPVDCCALRILLSQSDGMFRESARFGDVWPGGILHADLNGDGGRDVALANTILLGKGDGEFYAGPNLPYADPDWLQLPAGPAAAADLNGDSVPDLVYFGTTEGRTIVGFKGIGDGAFAPANPSSFWLHLWLNEDRRLAGTADFDGDGKPDVLTAVYCPAEIPSDRRYFGLAGCSDHSSNLTLFLNRVEPVP